MDQSGNWNDICGRIRTESLINRKLLMARGHINKLLGLSTDMSNNEVVIYFLKSDANYVQHYFLFPVYIDISNINISQTYKYHGTHAYFESKAEHAVIVKQIVHLF